MIGTAPRRVLALAAAFLAISLGCGGDAPARSVAGSFDFEVERVEPRPGVAPSLQGSGINVAGELQPEIGEAQAREITKQILSNSDIPGVGGDLIPGEAFLAGDEDLKALAGTTGLQLPLASEAESVFWIVNLGEPGPRNVPTRHHGAVVDATSGEVTNIFYNRISPISPIIAAQARQIVPESTDGIRSTLENEALSQLGQKFPHLLDAGFELHSEFPVITGGDAIIDAIADRGLDTDVDVIDPNTDYWLVNLIASGSQLLESIIGGVSTFSSEYYFAVIDVEGLDTITVDNAEAGVLLPGVRIVTAPRSTDPQGAGNAVTPTQSTAAQVLAPVFVEPPPPDIIPAERALELAELRLMGNLFPLIANDDRPIDLFLATRGYLVSLRQTGQLAFSTNALGQSTEYFWVVNYLDQRATAESPRFTGVVVDAESGTVVVTYLATGVAIPPP